MLHKFSTLFIIILDVVVGVTDGVKEGVSINRPIQQSVDDTTWMIGMKPLKILDSLITDVSSEISHCVDDVIDISS